MLEGPSLGGVSNEIRPRRLLIDVTHTISSGLKSGVQRVVRNLAEQLPETTRIPVLVVMHDGKCFREVDLPTINEAYRRLNSVRSDLLGQLPQGYLCAAETLCRILPSQRLRRSLLPKAGRQGLFRLPLKILQQRIQCQHLGARVAFSNHDLLLLPDAYWSCSKVWPTVRNAHRQGAYIASVIYDLIPLQYPQFVSKGADETFRQYLHEISSVSDMLVAISGTVKQQVAEALPNLWPDEQLCREVRSFELGAELSLSQGPVSEEVRALFDSSSRQRPYLMVATFEPRKNHKLVLDAFETIWERDSSRQLCLVGRVGWLCDSLLERIRNHPRLGRQLHILHQVTDAELAYCYRQAQAVILPSIVEGFGLPIIEALWHGCKVFASNTAIHREVGKTQCSYFDLNSSQALVQVIEEWEANLATNRSITRSEICLVSWHQSAKQLLATCLSGFASRAALRANGLQSSPFSPVVYSPAEGAGWSRAG